jgi:RNA polymerase-binding transcription factor
MPHNLGRLDTKALYRLYLLNFELGEGTIAIANPWLLLPLLKGARGSVAKASSSSSKKHSAKAKHAKHPKLGKPGKSAPARAIPRPVAAAPVAAYRPALKASAKTRPMVAAAKVRPTKSSASAAPSSASMSKSVVLIKTHGPVVTARASGKVVPTLNKKPANHAPPAIIPTPVPTDGKPRKNQAGMNYRELEHYRELLLAKRRELVGDMTSMEGEALRSTTGTNLSNLPLHMADMGTDNYEQEFTLGLVEKDRQLLREINRALAKIQDGTYGICEGTGKPISKARLEAQPWAKFSIEHARELEKGMLRR